MPRAIRKSKNPDPDPGPRRRMRLTRSKLAALGQKAGFETAAERAAAAGISRSHMLHIERGAVRPSPEVVKALAEAFHESEGKIERASDLDRESLANRTIEQIRSVS